MEFNAESGLTFRQLFSVLRRRRAIVVGLVLLTVSACIVYCIISTRWYEATGSVQVQKESADALGLDSIMSEASGASDAFEANMVLQTQSAILQSDTLALRTIEKLGIENVRDFRGRWNPISALMGSMSPKGTADPAGANLENSPQRRRRVLQVFESRLSVKPVAGTRIIEIRYLSSDPKIAAAVVNDLIEELANYQFQTRFNATTQASEWLTSQLSELRKQSEDLQAKVVGLERESGVYSLGTVDAQGREQAYSGVLDQLQQVTVALTQARQNKLLKESIVHAADAGDAELLSGLSGNSISGSVSMNNSLALIQTLRQQEANQKAALQEAESKYGPAYPKIGELRANLDAVEGSIKAEVERLRVRAQNDYKIAAENEAFTQAQYARVKGMADRLNDKAIEYTIARQEATESRDLYEALLKRLKEAGVLEGLKSSNITIVDPARIPAKPKKPNVPFYLVASIFGGLGAGCVGAFLVDSLDNKITSIVQVEEIIGQPALGVLPHIPVLAPVGEFRIISLNDPNSTFSEALRVVRTSLLLLAGEQRGRVILVTSAIPGEGKSTCALNLSVIMAQAGRKVLLVDGDLRRGTLRKRLGLPQVQGLSDLLAGRTDDVPRQTLPQIANLEIIATGFNPPNPAELLDSGVEDLFARWRKEYQVVIVDAPPLLPVTDAMIMDAFVDISLLVTRIGVTERSQLQHAYSKLSKGKKRHLGVIVNGLRQSDESYYGYYGYRRYSDNYGDSNNESIS